MNPRRLALGSTALIVLCVAIGLALAVRPGCPAGFHVSGQVCLSDGWHKAPSSGILIPDAQTAIQSRQPFRLELLLIGLLSAGALTVVAVKQSPRRVQPSSVTS